MQQQCTVCNMTFKEYQEWLKARGKPVVNPSRQPEVIPATGHEYQLVSKTARDASGICLITESCIHNDAERTLKSGDISADGKLTPKDVNILFNAVSGLNSDSVDIVIGDVSGDGKLTPKDVNLLFNYVSGLSSTLGNAS